MQFRPPFRPTPSNPSSQPQEFPTQHQGFQQPQQQFYKPQFQQPSVMQPQSSEKKSRKRFWYIIAAIVVVLGLASMVGSLMVNNSSTEHPQTTTVPTQVEHTSSQITPAGNSTTTAENPKNIKPTHGTAALYGQISDFIGTYGKPSTTNGKDSMWLLNTDGSLSLDARNTGRGVVGYVSISIPSSWSMQKAKAYCLAFAPHNYTPFQTSTPDNSGNLFVYNSPSGRFALHISSGYPLYCYMDTVSNP
jgi:hypothetical protein